MGAVALRIIKGQALLQVRLGSTERGGVLSLSLFMPWIFTNHTDDISSFYNSAALTEPLN